MPTSGIEALSWLLPLLVGALIGWISATWSAIVTLRTDLGVFRTDLAVMRSELNQTREDLRLALKSLSDERVRSRDEIG